MTNALYFFLKPKTIDQRAEFAQRCGMSAATLRAAMYGRQVPAEVALTIAEQSDGAVSFRDLRPDIWERLRKLI